MGPQGVNKSVPFSPLQFEGGGNRGVQYDGAGRKIAETDELGRTTQYGYDGNGRLISVTDAEGGITRYGYDEQGNKVSQTDAEGRVTRWSYDNLGRVLSRTLPGGQTERFGYDAAGRRVWHTDFNGETTHFSYDAADREVLRDYGNDADVSTTYTATGQLATVTDGRGSTHYQYDLRDRLTRIDYPTGSYVEYGYDANGNRTLLRTPHGETTYVYDAVNRLTSVSDDSGTTSYGYDAVGNPTSVSYPNGTATAYRYDARHRLTGIDTAGSGGPLLSLSYTLNPNGTRARIVEGDGRRVDYQYDRLDRLVEEAVTDPVRGDRTTRWVYDPVGNRLSETTTTAAGSETIHYVYDANDRLLEETGPAGTTTYSYDANGNLTGKASPSASVLYQWNDDDRLVGVSGPGVSASYRYDVFGILQEAVRNGVATHYLVDPNRDYAEVVAEEDAGGVAVAEYTHAHELVSQTRGAAAWYYHGDALGSTRVLSDGGGVASDSYVYAAYGEVEDATGGTENPYRFTGEYFDHAIGLQYNRARWYAGEIGRFASVDKFSGYVRNPASLHDYMYTAGNPVYGIDPSGYETIHSQMAVTNGVGTLSTQATVNVGRQFAGRAAQRAGEAFERQIYNAIRSCLKPGANIRKIRKADGFVDGDRIAVPDFLLSIGEKFKVSEVKTKLPTGKIPEALDRAAKQLRAAMNAKYDTAILSRTRHRQGTFEKRKEAIEAMLDGAPGMVTYLNGTLS